MLDLVHNTIKKYNMLVGKTKVVVGLSGGADSMCLLHFLVSNSERYGIQVSAAHVNHCLRGEESERDCEFVKRQCKLMGVPLYVKQADIAALSKERGVGCEQCGRDVRYEFFSELACDSETVIATAHTASDNAETVLLNITRGCGLDGLCGIPPIRGNIIRPLIEASRNNIEGYCQENSIPYVTDSTNLTTDYSRNKIRLEVMPTLREINSGAEHTVNRLSSIAAEETAYLRRVACEEYSRCADGDTLNVAKLSSTDEVIVRRVVKLAVERNLGIVPQKKHIDLICGIISHGGGSVTVGKGLTARICGGLLIFGKESDNNIEDVPSVEFNNLKLGGEYVCFDKRYIISEIMPNSPLNKTNVHKKLLNERISCAIMLYGVVLRNRRGGDVFRPLGRNCTKTVKKLFTELKIPVNDRDKRLVLAADSHVYWIEGIGVSQDAIAENEDFFTIEVQNVL